MDLRFKTALYTWVWTKAIAVCICNIWLVIVLPYLHAYPREQSKTQNCFFISGKHNFHQKRPLDIYPPLTAEWCSKRPWKRDFKSYFPWIVLQTVETWDKQANCWCVKSVSLNVWIVYETLTFSTRRSSTKC